MHSITRRLGVSVSCLALAALLPQVASAQSATDPESASQQPGEPAATTALNAEGQDNANDVIVVTARRQAEALTVVPLSISAFNERALDRLQASDTTGLQGAVPNLNIVQGRGSSNATNIFIRGIGQPDALQTFDPAVGVYVDDVYMSRIRGTQLDLLDLERVEVLRGPQGTLYGKNTIGGALKLVTRRPGDTLRGAASLAIGSYEKVEVKGSVSGPIGDGVAAGLAAMQSHRNGYVEDEVLDRDYNDKHTTALRGTLAFDAGADTRIDLAADYTMDRAAMTVGQPINPLTDLFGGPLLDRPENPDSDDYDFTGRTTPTLPNSTELDHWGLSAIVAHDLSPTLSLKSITAYRNLDTDDYIDIDATEVETGDVFVGVDQSQFSEELQLLLDGETLSGVFGLYYLAENVSSHQEAYADDLVGPVLGNPTFLRTIDDDLETRSYAAYGNVTVALTEMLNLSAGLRYTHENKDYFRTTSTFSSSPLLTSLAPFEYEPEDSWGDLSPMASIDFSPSEDSLVYARVAKGFKSGGFNGRANNPSETRAYDPETVWSYEVGAKARVADMLDVAVAVFHNDYTDFQARVAGLSEVDGIPEPSLAVLNAGELTIRGAELELALEPVEALRLDAQIGYLDAEYGEFADDRYPNGDRSFQMPAFAPDWTARFGAQYSADLGASGTLTFGGQTRYKGEHALAVDNTYLGTDEVIEGLIQEGYWLSDARIVWENGAGDWSIGLYGNNLTDERYKTDGQEFSSIGNIRTVYYGAPRTFEVKLGYRY
ncbi:TonB-dependent receptor [Sphingomicrobium arenosum]|uniref:TonB-dependent receptor n=1 Tax=Sphingomicrobium arenosum TaxID=2233861 RepID=UPI00224101A4|nr:TonB-dependent receptor [Sphingomicrobium arenosum]